MILKLSKIITNKYIYIYGSISFIILYAKRLFKYCIDYENKLMNEYLFLKKFKQKMLYFYNILLFENLKKKFYFLEKYKFYKIF